MPPRAHALSRCSKRTSRFHLLYNVERNHWGGRARGLAKRVAAVEQRLSGFMASKQAAASLLALQPVDADRVRDGLAVTEAMPAADGLNVNIVEREA